MKHIIDTHPLIWYITGSARLGTNAKAVLDADNTELVLPATALAEACWIVEHGRTDIDSVADLLAAVDADARLMLFPLDRAVIERSTTLTTIGEMHDRQIVATALLLAERGETVALLTRDENIIASELIPVVW